MFEHPAAIVNDTEATPLLTETGPADTHAWMMAPGPSPPVEADEGWL